jgi:hypothetical protein
VRIAFVALRINRWLQRCGRQLKFRKHANLLHPA